MAFNEPRLCEECCQVMAKYVLPVTDTQRLLRPIFLCERCTHERKYANLKKTELFPKRADAGRTCNYCDALAVAEISRGTNVEYDYVCSYHRVRIHPGTAPHRWLVGEAMQFDKVQDSGEREEFATGSRRDTQTGKGRPDLIPPYPMQRLAKHYENGANKYGDRNWEKGQPLMRYIASAKRHINDIEMGLTDEDHFMAAIWNLMSFVHTQYMIERGVLPKELNDYDEAVAQHRQAADHDNISRIVEQLQHNDTKTIVEQELMAEQKPEHVGIVLIGDENQAAVETIRALRRIWGVGLNETYIECMQSILDASDLDRLRKQSWK